jgi:hypothetical protein
MFEHRLTSLPQVRCANHSLQLAVGGCFKEVAVAGSDMVQVLAKGKALANSVKRSGPMLYSLRKACEEAGIPYTTLKNPNETRWNSQHTNLASILKLKAPLQLLANTDTIGDWAPKVFTPAEWKLAEAAVQILKIPLIATKMWEAEKNPTMNLMISKLYDMQQELGDLAQSQCRWL